MTPGLHLSEHDLPGRLVVFEGTDGAGKSTMVEMTRRALEAAGHTVVVTRQPTTESRELPLFRRFVYQPEERERIDFRALLCFMVGDRIQHVHEVVRPALAAGGFVLCDRYVYTLIATMRARGHEAEERWVADACRGIMAPDAALLLDVPLDLAVRRIAARQGREDSCVERSHLRRTQEEFRRLADDSHLHLVDASDSDPRRAFAEVWRMVAPLLGAAARDHR